MTEWPNLLDRLSNFSTMHRNSHVYCEGSMSLEIRLIRFVNFVNIMLMMQKFLESP